jgi:Tfp pilus assembly protein PilX
MWLSRLEESPVFPNQAYRRRSREAAPRRARRGFALEGTLFIMLVFAALIAAALTAVRTFTRASGFDYRATRVSHAAEGGADDIMSQLETAMQDGVVTATDLTSLQLPVLPGFVFTQRTRTTAQPATRTITSGPYAGLFSLNQPMDIEVTATDSARNSASVVLSVTAQSIPLFQFGVFYEGDLEILPGPAMEFEGWVHSNANIYIDGPLTFRSNITTPDSLFRYRKDQFVERNGVQIANNAGTLNLLTFDSRSAAGLLFVQNSEVDFGGRVMAGVSGVRPLRLPLPTGVPTVELIRPRSGGDSPAARDVKLAWQADFTVQVDLAQLRALARPFPDSTIRLGNACSGATPLVTITRSGGRPVPPASQCDLIFDGVANAFYDGREDRRPDIVELDLAALGNWVDLDPGVNRVDVLYVEFINPLPGDDRTDYPAVRLRNGARLPSTWSPMEPGGLTVSTDHPMYVQGDYNTIEWKPAALFADCLTYQSPAWQDAQQYNYALRPAAPMSVFAAIAAGHSETPWDYQRVGGNAPYGGGLENYPRFVEDWTATTLTYRGSLVSLFTAARSTGLWGNGTNVPSPGSPIGGYYVPPNRDWRFDMRFRDPRNLPPGTPRVGSVVQTAYRSRY